MKFRTVLRRKDGTIDFHLWGFYSDEGYIGPLTGIFPFKKLINDTDRWTGLSDSDGKDIYSNDIISIKTNVKSIPELKFLVTWSKEKMSFLTEPIDHNFFELDYCPLVYIIDEFGLSRIKIVSNRYKNQDNEQ